MYDFCFAILCSNKNQYSIFDPHAKYSVGNIDVNETAGLFLFQNSAEMVNYLNCTTTGENVQIDLYPVTVKLMRSEMMEESVPCVETENSHKPVSCREAESLNEKKYSR
jgi:hypothetical protein